MELTDTENSLYYSEIFPMIYQRLIQNRERDKRWNEIVGRNIDILVGRTVHNMSYAELARDYNISSTRVMQIVAKMLRLCRKVLTDTEYPRQYFVDGQVFIKSEGTWRVV
jgi:hypothetical protein